MQNTSRMEKSSNDGEKDFQKVERKCLEFQCSDSYIVVVVNTSMVSFWFGDDSFGKTAMVQAISMQESGLARIKIRRNGESLLTSAEQ